MVNVADRIVPLEFAEPGVVERAAAEADDPRLERLYRGNHIGPPTGDCVFGHERRIVEPERARSVKLDRERGGMVRLRGDEPCAEPLPVTARGELRPGILGPIVVQPHPHG